MNSPMLNSQFSILIRGNKQYSPPFQRRGARGIKSLEAEGGVVSKRSRSAPHFLLEVTNHPVCAAKERDLLIEAQPPLLENGGEWALFQLSDKRKLSWTAKPVSGGELPAYDSFGSMRPSPILILGDA
jgi:hypothetical protein